MSIALLPDTYRAASEEELFSRIGEAKEALGGRLCILGHHYQREEVIQFADFRGDSFGLSQSAAALTEPDYIVFCGVHFMAEAADILSPPARRVVLPDMRAGCPMANMASVDEVLPAWDELVSVVDPEAVVPITYMNSDAELKAFVGQQGGAVCTSSNAAGIFRWAFGERPKVLFFPDEHLGRNTAYAVGVPLEEMVVWDPDEPMGGLSAEEVRRSKVILWKGYCHVHTHFTPEMVQEVRSRWPDMKVIVHPECTFEVVQLSDATGSTGGIIKTVASSPPASQWAVGTEVHLVNRLSLEHLDKTVVPLDRSLCGTMFLINPQNLCWVLEELVGGGVVNEVAVSEDVRRWARVALDRMLAIPS
jgi:quinolinate synthase